MTASVTNPAEYSKADIFRRGGGRRQGRRIHKIFQMASFKNLKS